MKKIVSTAILSLALSGFAHSATVTLIAGSQVWGDKDDVKKNGMPWGFVIDTTGQPFDSETTNFLSQALAGFSLPEVVFEGKDVLPVVATQIGDTDYWFVRGRKDSETGPPPSFSDGIFDKSMFYVADHSDDTQMKTEVESGHYIAAIWFDEGTTVVEAGDFFGFDDLTGYQVPLGGATVTIPTENVSPGYLSYQVVPEPSVMLLGALGGLMLVGRRKR